MIFSPAARAKRSAWRNWAHSPAGWLTKSKIPSPRFNLISNCSKKTWTRRIHISKRVIHRLQTVQRETARCAKSWKTSLRYAGKIELDKKPTDVNELLEELTDFFSPQAQAQAVQLRLRKSDSQLIVPADSRLLKQAILNLMINALQAMPGGGELILSASRFNGEARIDVVDTGGGIPPETARNIFQAYYSTKKSGTGLGLAISQRIAREHGGSITLNTEVGKGSDFTVHLPLENAERRRRRQVPRRPGVRARQRDCRLKPAGFAIT